MEVSKALRTWLLRTASYLLRTYYVPTTYRLRTDYVPTTYRLRTDYVPRTTALLLTATSTTYYY